MKATVWVAYTADMPIAYTDIKGVRTVKFSGCVVEVRHFKASRNHSDTLDYSDFRETDVTEALVYRGRTKQEWNRETGGGTLTGERPVGERFEWVDCTCLFRDRGQDIAEPRVDDVRHPDCVEDYVAHVEWLEQQRVLAAAKALEHAEFTANRKREEELNRPVLGKRMVVIGGRKVKPGTEGTVAFIRDDRALLKADHEWQDRKAQGVWVAIDTTGTAWFCASIGWRKIEC